MLKFNQSVVVSEVMTTLQEAAKGGTFGGFQINSIKQIFPQFATPTKGTMFGRSCVSILLTCSSCRKHPAFYWGLKMFLLPVNNWVLQGLVMAI